MIKRYFDEPTQVKYWNGEDEGYCGGIAYKDEVICACCGAIVEISDIFDLAEEDGVAPIIDFPWIDLNDEVIGG